MMLPLNQDAALRAATVPRPPAVLLQKLARGGKILILEGLEQPEFHTLLLNVRHQLVGETCRTLVLLRFGRLLNVGR